MRALWRGIVRTIFWSYERGSWPYDALVVAMVAFVLLTPRQWFHDQAPNVAAGASDIEVVWTDDVSALKTYRVSSSLLPPPKRSAKATPELEREMHSLLRRNADELRGHTFQILRIQVRRAADGSVLHYDVTVKPSSP